jgi:hypothetical protein
MNREIDPTRSAPNREPTGDDELDTLLNAIERASEQSLDNNARMLDGHLKASDRVIANVAALKLVNEGDDLLKAALSAAGNPT